ncbi:hypothetical protein CXB51_026092 [Gossypium anomalum]|uniref:R13L1/DRL21-like LRR repeat region domain-containing protein n=1 Tax=Gossypium anomalum TaxID=47600 RepID=A0A8J6CS26_9ROSI|nr:hypothetical protein CXB51_026092 [Gossypium anomalum]
MNLDIKGCDGLDYMPCGLGQITCLQTLPKFVVGKRGREVGQLRELKGLKNLKGQLKVSCLEYAGTPELGSTYLKDKLYLKSLWNDFECLQPHPNLDTLVVHGYQGSKISCWLSSIMNLTELCLEFCFKCKHLPPLHQLSSLKVLKLLVLGLESLEDLSNKSTTIFFPSLEEVHIHDCPNLKEWWRPGDVGEASNAHLPCFHHLTYLIIECCPNLTSMPLFPPVRKLKLRKTGSKPLQKTMKLKSTTIKASSSAFPPFSKLESLDFQEIEDLDSMPSLHQLSSLQVLKLHKL